MTADRTRKEVSAGGVVVRLDGGELLFLLIRDRYRNWGFPKGHLKPGEAVGAAALREVVEETGLDGVMMRGPLDAIEWRFTFRGRPIHKICHFFLMETTADVTAPQRSEGITACRWATYDEAERIVSYDNAREVLRRARALASAPSTGA